MSNFSITDNKGFQLTFENGWIVSVQFGPGNYGDNRAKRFTGDSLYGDSPYPGDSELAEVGVFRKDLNPDGKTVWWKGEIANSLDFDGSGIAGYQNANQVARIIETVSKL